MDELPIAFFDLETRSKVDLPKYGLHRYARDPSTEVLCMSVRFPDGEYGVWAPESRRAGLTLKSADWVFRRWTDWVDSGGLVCAWNATFDRTVLKYQEVVPAPQLKQTICAMAQAENYSLPGSLGKAAAALGVPVQKDAAGKRLIGKLCDANRPWDPDPNDVAHFWSYAMKDALAMYEVFKRCRPWTRTEWRDYHVIERLNERGIRVDTEFAWEACKYGAAAEASLNRELQDLTGDPRMTLASSVKKVKWLAGVLDGTGLEDAMLVKRGRKKATRSTGAPALHAIREKYDELEGKVDPDRWERFERFAEIVEAGNGVAIKKFAKMCELEWEGRLYHQFNCSPTITGRHASRGVQFDNVLREGLQWPKGGSGPDPAEYAIALVKEGAYAGDISRAFDLPIAKVLARLIRPSIIAPEGSSLIWGDWSAIEARVLPWLAQSESTLDSFRAGECVYSKEAVKIFGLSGTWQDLYARYRGGDPEATQHRLLGKIAVLALGYAGGVGALSSMARAYGLRLDAEFADSVKVRFRAANPWLTRFWDRLTDVAWFCVQNPGIARTVGRLRYIRHGADLYCFLPDGRPITYPQVRIETVWKERFERYIDTLTYRKIWSGTLIRGELYSGVLAENATQGTAASLLRWALRELDAAGHRVWAPKHDEVLIEGSPDDVPAVRAIMESGPAWASGLPLKADVRSGPYYGK